MALVLLAGCSEKETRLAILEGDGWRLEYPLDPHFEIARIDGGFGGLVRVFGDGRVVVRPRDEKAQDGLAQLVLTRSELDTLLFTWARSGLFSPQAEEVRFPPLATDTLPFRVTFHLGRYLGGGVSAVGPYYLHLEIYNPDLQPRYSHHPGWSRPPEALAILDAFDLLVSFRTHPDLVPIDVPVGQPTIPAWAQPVASSPPQLMVRQGGALWLMDWLGGNRKRLTALPQEVYGRVSASPSGDELVYRAPGQGLFLSVLQSDGSHRVPQGESLRSLGLKDGHTPVFSSDGRRLAFLGQKDGQWRLFVLERQTRSLSEWAEELGKPRPQRPVAWSHDGQRLYFEVFVAFEPTAPVPGPRVWVADLRSVRPVVPGPARGFRLAPVGRYAAYLAPATRPEILDGRSLEEQRLALATVLARTALWVVRLDGRHGTCLWPCRPTRVAVGATEFDWEPKGARLVYVANDDRGQGLWVTDRRGRSHELLVQEDVGPFGLFQPNWSPDGEAIVFRRSTPPGSMVWRSDPPQIWIVGADGSDLRKVAPGSDPIWWGEAQAGVDELAS